MINITCTYHTNNDIWWIVSLYVTSPLSFRVIWKRGVFCSACESGRSGEPVSKPHDLPHQRLIRHKPNRSVSHASVEDWSCNITAQTETPPRIRKMCYDGAGPRKLNKKRRSLLQIVEQVWIPRVRVGPCVHRCAAIVVSQNQTFIEPLSKASASVCDPRVTPALIVFTQAGNVLMVTGDYSEDKRRRTRTQCSAAREQMAHNSRRLVPRSLHTVIYVLTDAVHTGDAAAMLLKCAEALEKYSNLAQLIWIFVGRNRY